MRRIIGDREGLQIRHCEPAQRVKQSSLHNGLREVDRFAALAMTIFSRPPTVLSAALLMALTAVPQVRAADVALGEQVFKKCERCHTLNAGGAQEEGPNLHSVFGRKAGTAPGWKFSDAMKASNIVWNRQNMDEYLAKPKEFMPDGTMNFPGLRKPEERQAVIDYLEQATK